MTSKSFQWYNIKHFITQVSERKRKDFHHKKNFTSRVSFAHTGKGKLDVLCKYCSNFQSTDVYYPWLSLCWPKFPPGGMVWPLPETRNLGKSGFLMDWVLELKSSKAFCWFWQGCWWWTFDGEQWVCWKEKLFSVEFFFKGLSQSRSAKGFSPFHIS